MIDSEDKKKWFSFLDIKKVNVDMSLIFIANQQQAMHIFNHTSV